MNQYQHTQHATAIVVGLIVMSVVFAVIAFATLRPLLAGVPIFLVSAWLFHSLTIEIHEQELHWKFGPGLVRKSVRLEAIASARQVRTNILEGWGIHLSRFGWLYNVSGWDAVAITLKSGKRFALGTDEPAALVDAIHRATKVPPQPSHVA